MNRPSTKPQLLGHVSDLHFGQAPWREEAARTLCDALVQARVEHVVISGDVTQWGRPSELEAFRRVFAPLLETGRATVVPGNHDRIGIAGESIMAERVEVVERPGVFIIKLDSTGAHNRSVLSPHGNVSTEDIAAVDEALDQAPRASLVVLTLHHHPLPLPMEGVTEQVASWMGLPLGDHLLRGADLLEVLAGRCDLVLHGHKHIPAAQRAKGERPMIVLNAGSSTELGRARVISHAGGRLQGRPFWLAHANNRGARGVRLFTENAA